MIILKTSVSWFKLCQLVSPKLRPLGRGLGYLQNNDRLYTRIESILYRDIRRSLILDERIEMFKDLITEDNEEILRKIID